MHESAASKTARRLLGYSSSTRCHVWLAEPRSRILTAGYMPKHAAAFEEIFCSRGWHGQPALNMITGHVQDHLRHAAGGARGTKWFDDAAKIPFHTVAHRVVA